MSQTELIVPEQTTEESTVINRFIEASRDIVPTVQISLAKRIMHPGSNRVVCLAAHTSVPLHPDEAASVSDLALRLSDGTNVRLSLSFFNDGAYVPEFPLPSPFPRTIYDPHKYEPVHSSRMPTALMALLIVAAAGAWFAPDSPLRHLLKMPTASTSTVPLPRTIESTTTLGAPKDEAKPIAPVAESTPTKTTVSTHKKTHKPKSTVAHAHSNHPSAPPSGQMTLVPPPPPTPWTFAPGASFQPIDQLPSQFGTTGVSAPASPVAAPPVQHRRAAKQNDAEKHDAISSIKKATADRSRTAGFNQPDAAPTTVAGPSAPRSDTIGQNSSAKVDMNDAPDLQQRPPENLGNATQAKTPDGSQAHPALDISDFPGYGMARTK